jgi:hypothetical protein
MVDLSTLPVTEGFAPFNVPAAGKPCQTYYKIIGDLKGGKRPLVALNGGTDIPSLVQDTSSFTLFRTWREPPLFPRPV